MVYRFLLTPRWLALHVVVLLVIPAFVLLGQWQFGRFEERSAERERVLANLAAAPAPLHTLARPGQAVREADVHRTVTVSGSYDAARELVVRRRPQHGKIGFYVLTPLVTAEGDAVLVNRGWVPQGSSPDAMPRVPAPPAGRVTVTGRLRLGESEESTGITERAGLPAGQILLINTETIRAGLPYEIVDGYIDLVRQSPAPPEAPAPVPEPDVGGGGGLNLAYGVQWWLFIGVAIGGWFFLIRREVADRRAAAAKEHAEAVTVGPSGAAEGRG